MRYVRAQGTFDPPLRLTAGAVALELGAGTGAAGLALAAAHPLARVLLTDLPGVCPLLRANAPAAAYPNVQVRALAWGCAAHAREVLRAAPPALVFGSDLVYFPALHAPLLRTLLQLTGGAEPARTEVLLAYRVRELQKEAPFWAAFGLWFVFAPVLVQEAGAGGRWTRLGAGSEGDGEVYVFSARRRAESVGWEVPEDDGELLEGVEARGTRVRKGDDAFELLLLMGVEE
ncbi:putative methyltransferase-domain-containing protein [Gloeopeniophorella convolvens]|nr:putative methyltransferase-domain-containing protein [Gloeopeniophorella convolvens]